MARGKVSPRYSPKRKGGDADGTDPNAWLGTYGDMITLLMAFFVMLYAISQVDQVKFRAFVNGLQAPFGNQTDVGLLDGGASLADGTTIPQIPGGDTDGLMPFPPLAPVPSSPEATPTQPPPTPAPEPTPQEPASGEPTPDGDEQPEPSPELLAVAAALREALEREGLPADIAEVRPDERGVVISVASDDVLFPLGSARVSRLGAQIVKAVASIVADLPNEVIVEGHTDNLPLRRGGYDNWNLSTDRAVAVLQLLVDHDVPPKRLIASGYGEYRPRVDNDSKTNRALNRRVDVVLVAR